MFAKCALLKSRGHTKQPFPASKAFIDPAIEDVQKVTQVSRVVGIGRLDQIPVLEHGTFHSEGYCGGVSPIKIRAELPYRLLQFICATSNGAYSIFYAYE